MATRDKSSSVIIAILLILSFPFWIGIIGGAIGIVIGLFGAVIGIFAGVLGALIGVIAFPFKLILGDHSGWGFFPDFGYSNFLVLVIIVLVALLVQRKRSRA